MFDDPSEFCVLFHGPKQVGVKIPAAAAAAAAEMYIENGWDAPAGWGGGAAHDTPLQQPLLCARRALLNLFLF